MLTHTTVIILITIIVSFVAWQSPTILQRFIFHPYTVKQGEFDRFITHGFIHGDGWHLFFNMFTLYFFGRIIEQLYVAKFGFLGFLGFLGFGSGNSEAVIFISLLINKRSSI